jgi:hypothetical protein
MSLGASYTGGPANPVKAEGWELLLLVAGYFWAD